VAAIGGFGACTPAQITSRFKPVSRISNARRLVLVLVTVLLLVLTLQQQAAGVSEGVFVSAFAALVISIKSASL
jgi:hypothetical protein